MVVLGLAAPLAGARAEPVPRVDVHLFWRADCPHCERAIAFLDPLVLRDPRIRLHRHELPHDPAGRALFARAVERFGIAHPAVPMLVVGERVLIGYRDEATTGREIEALVAACLAAACPDPLSSAPLAAAAPDAMPPATAPQHLPERIALPLIGEVATASLSLPVLTVVLGALDGFNPCAMWVLVFLIGLLLGLKDRRRMWLLGGTFLLASAAVYFLFLAAWLNLLLLLGALVWVRLAVGTAALVGGVHYLRGFARGDAGVCRVTAPERRRRIFERLRALARAQSLPLALLGIALLAFAVNLVELLCSAGLPAVYTGVLTRTALPAWQYYLYLVLYIAVFMADDMAVFATAMLTLRLAGPGTAYARHAQLIGGVVLTLIGALLLVRPEWLMFG